VLSAIGGALSGLAGGIQQQHENQMQQILLRAQLAQMGASNALASGADASDPSAPGGGVSTPPVMNPGAALMSGGSASGADASVAAPPPATPAPSGSDASPAVSGASVLAPGVGNSTQSGVGPQIGNSTQSGTTGIPTDMAGVLKLARAAQTGPSPTSTGANAGGSVLPALIAAKAATGGAPTGSPITADPFTSAVNDYVGQMRPTGSVDLGNGMTMPSQVSPQRAQMLSALFEAKARQATQLQNQGFQTGLEKQREGFETGQQSTLLGAESTRQQALLGSEASLQQQQLATQKQISANQLTLEGKRLDQQHDQMLAMLGFRITDQSNKAKTAVLGDVKPIEDQIMNIQHAQQVLQDGRGNPADVSAGLLSAWTALGPAGKPRMNAAIVQIAGGSPDESIPAKLDRIGTMAANGTLPTKQTDLMQSALSGALTGYQQQWHAKVASGIALHPEAPDLAGEMAIREKLVTGAAPGGGPLVSAGKPDIAQYKKQNIGIGQYNKDLAAWYAGQPRSGASPQGAAGVMAAGAGR
jgi:hypothetical protein